MNTMLLPPSNHILPPADYETRNKNSESQGVLDEEGELHTAGDADFSGSNLSERISPEIQWYVSTTPSITTF